MGVIMTIKKRIPPRGKFVTFIHDKFVLPCAEVAEEFADRYLGMAKQAIYTERYKSDIEPLSKAYLKSKLRDSYDPRVFIKTGFFVEHLRVMEKNRGKRRWYFAVGFPEQLKEPGSDLTCNQLGRVLTFGNSRVPARPIFKLVADEFYKKVVGDGTVLRKKALAKIPRSTRDFGRFPASVDRIRVNTGKEKVKKRHL